MNEAVELIKLEIVNIGDQRIENWCRDFCSYIEDYWMNGIHNRVEWNYYDVISDNHLTNNIFEGIIDRLMHRIGLKKASIYRVFQTLQSELDTAKNKVDTFCAGSQVPDNTMHCITK